RLDLAHALARDSEASADLLQRVHLAVGQPVAHLEDVPLAFSQLRQRRVDVLPHKRRRRRLQRGDGIKVFDEVTKLGRLHLTYRRVEGDGLTRQPEKLASPLRVQAYRLGDLLDLRV